MRFAQNGVVRDAGELVIQARGLLGARQWEEAALHVRQAAQHVRSRLESETLRRLCLEVPLEVRRMGTWPHALLWVAFRCDDLALLREVLLSAPRAYPAFLAFEASVRLDWQEVLHWAALEEAGGPDGGLAARYTACALASLEQAGWVEAYQAALERVTGRDRGLVWLEFAYFLAMRSQDTAARDAYARALAFLRGDTHSLALAHANLGITCLRLGELPAAERALRDALAAARKPGGGAHLSTIWRGLGGVAMQQLLFHRAEHAFREAERHAQTVPDRTNATHGRARALRQLDRLDEALHAIHDAIQYAELTSVPHHLHIDLATLHVLTGNLPGAAASLKLAHSEQPTDDWRKQIVEAELDRLQGGQTWRDTLGKLQADVKGRSRSTWLREEAHSFPTLFACMGLAPGQPRPPALATVNADGPIRLQVNGQELPLKSHLSSASLLAFLVANDGTAGVERTLEAIHFPGETTQQRRKELSRAVRQLRDTLGWETAVLHQGGTLQLTPEVEWAALRYPPPQRRDLFCEGRFDPWVLEWQQQAYAPQH